MQKSKKITSSTQNYLSILEIKDDCVVLKDGTLRAVLLVSSVNFALKSEEEQNAIIQGYVQFLNSLDFPIQIVIQSRKLNIDAYLERLQNIERQQINELLRMQTADYIQYVRGLVEMGDIMTKRFYVIIPYSTHKERPKGFWTRLMESFSPVSTIHLKQQRFEKYRQELAKRVDYIMTGLASCGLSAIRLDTQSLIELYYNTYNPESSPQQKLIDINKINLES